MASSSSSKWSTGMRIGAVVFILLVGGQLGKWLLAPLRPPLRDEEPRPATPRRIVERIWYHPWQPWIWFAPELPTPED